MRLRSFPREAVRFARRCLGRKPEPPEELAPIMNVLRAGDTFVDIGAHAGLFSAEAASRVGPTGTVLAIEPNPTMLKQLVSSVAGLPNVQIASVAVGEATRQAQLHVFKQDTRSSLLKNGRANKYTLDTRNRSNAITVPVKPLLDILSWHSVKKVDALKIDIEGYEDRALIPFFRTAPRELWPAYVMIERSPHVWAEDRGGPGCLNRFSASISGASAGVRLPGGGAAG